jgi:5-hydroxyisourate hydrolase-like protein (transthyretin family)
MTISTHVLDTEAGEPGAGIKVGLFDGKELISLQETNEDGRIVDLSEGQSLGPGEYRLVYYVDSGFFEKVEVTIAVHPGEHYHVPLLLSSYSCVIYRGS